MGHSAKSGKGSLFSSEPEDYNKMGSHGSKPTLHNGYRLHSRLSLTTLKWHSKLFRTSKSCQSEPSSMRWRKCQGQGLQHNSASVRDRSRECSFVENLHQTQTPLPLRKCALDLPTQFIGQRNCGVTVCVVAQQSGSVRDLQAPGQPKANEHTFEKRQTPKTSCSSHPVDCSLNSTRQITPNSMGHTTEGSDGYRSMHEVFFTTEVPQKVTINHKTCPKEDSSKPSGNKGQPLNEDVFIFKSKKAQRVLQEQIRKVVVNLEEVLRGLKEVHLEMKEVVQQIDQLTSRIDLGEEDSGEASGYCSPIESICAPEDVKKSRRLGACCKDQKRSESHLNVDPPAYQTALSSRNNSGRKFNHGTAVSQMIKGPKSEAGAQSRSRKPPPYSIIWGANKGKTPPYAGRRRLLSTTV
ncbi:uncharacterized protein LOC124390945 [Silurus meridionalis]|uniref:Uncharacterized protein n=1 Tax=Silurus meridionalis TaxID=175797 RepID=A0A8T0B893_SILME|nr:uncharacterized protein LOC124390945 [Silurus meridionalis]KAF7703042.1 hypothetical protein HF521_022049 [Silurus meridionalis]KAI5101089.1 hypothetical protein C0J45_8292 [Silurus meridionalis]